MNYNISNLKKITFCFPEKLSEISKKVALEQIVENVKEIEEIGFAGYIEKEYLKEALDYRIFGDSQKVCLPDISKQTREIEECVTKGVSKCNKTISVPSLYVFIFPTQDRFIQEQMNGVSGFSPYQKTVHLYVNSEVKGWLEKLSETVAHETAHVISHELFNWETILDILIFEGIAEHFREKTVGGERAPWTKAISSQKAKEIIEKLEKENLLSDREDEDLYNNLFFGGDEFPQWSGYTIGYMIIKSVLENSDKSIDLLIKTEPQKIFELYKKLSK